MLKQAVPPTPPAQEPAVDAAIREIVRSVDLHSRRLVLEHGLTGPQITALQTAHRLSGCTTGELARAVGLSQPTVTGILDRLERKSLVSRTRDTSDRRAVVVRVTEAGAQAAEGKPSLLHGGFHRNFATLAPWEQNMILAALQRVAALMRSP